MVLITIHIHKNAHAHVLDILNAILPKHNHHIKSILSKQLYNNLLEPFQHISSQNYIRSIETNRFTTVTRYSIGHLANAITINCFHIVADE